MQCTSYRILYSSLSYMLTTIFSKPGLDIGRIIDYTEFAINLLGCEFMIIISNIAIIMIIAEKLKLP